MACQVAPPAVTVRCPPLRTYPPEFDRALGEAMKRLRAAEPDNPILDALESSQKLRSQCRALEAK